MNNKPTKLNLNTQKEYFWCTCGLSQKQPLCDSAHKTTDMRPLKFSPEKNGEANLCNCKKTNNPPYCDGSHNQT